MKQWSEANSGRGGNINIGKYIGVYFAFGIGASFLMALQTIILWIFCSIEVGHAGGVYVGRRYTSIVPVE